MKIKDTVCLVCCSNGMNRNYASKIDKLISVLEHIGLSVKLSPFMFQKDGVKSADAVQRAQVLMDCYRDSSVKAIFDISGGDIANEILPYLDFEVIGSSDKQFWGYSDLTTIINAIYTKTGNASVLYQVRNLISDYGDMQQKEFTETIFEKNDSLLSFPYEFIQGDNMQGVIVGGNIRCLLKLAGTVFFPDTNGKILMLEACSGTNAKLITYYSQLKQIGAFDGINGILLGTFTQMEEEGCVPDACTLLYDYIDSDVPIAKTPMIGHSGNSKAIEIGKYYKLYCK